MRVLTGLGIKDGIALIENSPAVICSGVSQDAAAEVKKILEKQGATVVIGSP